MKKKLKDMVVGDKFTGHGYIYTVNYTCCSYVVVYVDKRAAPEVFSNFSWSYEMVEPEPEWLYECIVLKSDGGAEACWLPDKYKHNRNQAGEVSKVEGGRKMHPDTFEIVKEVSND